MDNWTEKRELVRIAKLYYFNGLTQAEIAKKVGVSRPVISKMLQRAKDLGIVDIIIKDETVNIVELEQQLENRFDLDEVYVVPVGGSDNDEVIKQLVAKVAAHHFAKWMKDKKRIGISWGTTLYHMVNQLPYDKSKGVKIYPLVGGIGRHRIEIHANQLAYELSKKLGATCEFLYAPAIVESIELKKQLLESTEIRTLLEEMKKVDIAVLGIGNPYESTMVEMGYLKAEDIAELRENEAVCDIGSRFIDQSGKEIETMLNSKVIGIELSDLKNIPTTVCVVSGVNKVEAIHGALNGKYFDKLVLDELTAAELLKRCTEV
ncbi:sugar-binding transcriptional regulator [Brevibacillus massiliensis]|uniref:sugar-binding transcriptional regulator n=1 Tax=Brevibacillus massiliensis TaxID=1118054 RepID=UPI0002D3BA5F|nr:sugar-binding transcriptional regulator [Brevibacillus massiliensis]